MERYKYKYNIIVYPDAVVPTPPYCTDTYIVLVHGVSVWDDAGGVSELADTLTRSREQSGIGSWIRCPPPTPVEC
jgi:hypothetical protein